MPKKIKKTLLFIVDGVNSIFYGDNTLLVKSKFIRNDSEALRKDWEDVGVFLIEASESFRTKGPNYVKPKQKKIA